MGYCRSIGNGAHIRRILVVALALGGFYAQASDDAISRIHQRKVDLSKELFEKDYIQKNGKVVYRETRIPRWGKSNPNSVADMSAFSNSDFSGGKVIVFYSEKVDPVSLMNAESRRFDYLNDLIDEGKVTGPELEKVLAEKENLYKSWSRVSREGLRYDANGGAEVKELRFRILEGAEASPKSLAEQIKKMESDFTIKIQSVKGITKDQLAEMERTRFRTSAYRGDESGVTRSPVGPNRLQKPGSVGKAKNVLGLLAVAASAFYIKAKSEAEDQLEGISSGIQRSSDQQTAQ